MTRRREYDPFALPHGAGNIEQRRDKWLARWTEKGYRKARQFPTQKAAHDFLIDLWTRKQQGRYIDADQLTVRLTVEQWIDRGDWQPATVATYRQRARTCIYPELGEVLIITLARNRVQHWIDTLRRQGYGASTIHGAVHVLSASLSSAVDLGILAENPCERTRRPTTRRKPVKVWTLADVQKVLAWLGGTADSPTSPLHGVAADSLLRADASVMLYALYRLALTTGMRPGELRALQWRDIDFERSIVTISRSMTKDSDGRTTVGTSTKTHRVRSIVLTAETLSSLSRWKSEQSVTQLPGYVFTGQSGGPLPLTSWQRYHKRLCADAGVPLISLHALRHTAATLLMELGQHPRIVSEILGHQSIQITLDTYSHVSQQMQQAALEAIERGLIPTDPPSPQQSRNT